jgi:hypothetical protein
MSVLMECITIGSPLKGTKPLGNFFVIWPKRVPRPAAMMTAVVI